MPSFKNKFRISKIFTKSRLPIIVSLLLIALVGVLLWDGNTHSTQSTDASLPRVTFEGEYRIGDGDWQTIEEGEHIPVPRGEVTLRLRFSLTSPSGEPLDDSVVRTTPIAFYANHIGLTFYENGQKIHVADNENPAIGEPACGINWTSPYVKIGAEAPALEIVVSNPHRFGNETAIDEMLDGLAIRASINFEKDILNQGEPQRNAGMLLMLVSVVFLGIALFSSLIHVKSSRLIWLLGLVVLFAGMHATYSAYGVSFWSESVITNTTLLGASMMLYMLFLAMLTYCLLKSARAVGRYAVTVLALADAVFFLLPVLTRIYFYDTWMWWYLVQLAVNAVLAYCLIRELLHSRTKIRWLYASALLPLISFALDFLGTWIGWWNSGLVSRFVFIALFGVATVMVLKLIPNNINAATKAKELEMEKIVLNAELAESRISTMMSQIRPHFIYNTLGSIEQLCELDPPKAGELVHDFAKYLRGNFGELDNPKPILMSQEMDHVHHYVSIENVRFPDMTFSFEMNSSDFRIPALTIQPIVENAIKHGLMKLQRGGSIRVVSYETDEDYCVSVEDDGVGFDTGLLLDERKHVGLRNIRERLKAMVNGSIKIESNEGVGTTVLIRIPKEGKK